ncbi:flagellar hook-associated protein FlgL [Planctomonas psychrotolerans]|uniref:flagellar hook-associated protein FlgL n=1 Tax=Planctomonas psychrotolerans TaxID=2528712 RepID=UPI001239E3F8|nr:flagellar hook-associated protein FlgL [Planctomonas psychrotolerans]
MIARVTNTTLSSAAQRNLQTNMQRLAILQEQASSQKAISRPSDDPAGTGDSLRIRAQQRAVGQYERNVDNGNGWLTVADSALVETERILGRVRDLTVQGANDGALSPSAKESIATELTSLRKELLTQANASYLGRSVFAGNSDAGAAFVPDATAPGGVVFTGSDSAVQRRIGENSTVRVDADGAAVFGTGTSSVFALVDTIVRDLQSGTNVGSHLSGLDDRLTAILGNHADVGVRHAQIQHAEEALMKLSGSLEAQRSSIEDVDLGSVILDLKLQEVTYQSALAVTARVLQPTLMDFLR